MNALGAVMWIVAIPMIAVFAVFLNEVALGLLPLREGNDLGSRPPRTVILIPAHDEAAGIAQTLSRLRDSVPEDVRILVVADNCSDATAETARSTGAEVIERSAPERRGKGYALDFGRSHLAGSAPDCVMILDADCVPDLGAVEALSAAAFRLGRPAQSVNLMRAGPDAGPVVQISNFAFMIKNLVRQRGLIRSGGPAMLTGTGMAFPWPVFERLALASSNIVEDLAITVSLTRQGVRPMLVESARVWSDAATATDTLTQRTRWEHGFIGTAIKHALPTLAMGLGRRQLGSVRLGLHLLVPPLALLFVLGFALLIIFSGLAVIGATTAPALLLLGMMATSVMFLALAWWREGRALLSIAAIFRIPLYVLWKIPVYLKLVRGAETEWIRTKRPD